MIYVQVVYLGDDSRKHPLERGKGRKPIKGIMWSRLMFWAVEAQTHKGSLGNGTARTAKFLY